MRKLPFILSFYLWLSGFAGLLFSGQALVVIFAPSLLGSALSFLFGAAGMALAAFPELRQPRVKRWSVRLGLLMMALSLAGGFFAPNFFGLTDDVYIHFHLLYSLFVGSVFFMLLGLEPEPRRVPLRRIKRRYRGAARELHHFINIIRHA